MSCNSFSQQIRILAIFSLACLAISCGEGDGPKAVVDSSSPSAKEYTLVWADEFNEGSAPNVKNWRIETGYGDDGWGNQEWQLYTDSSDNVRVENGNLVITALCSKSVTAPAECNDGATAYQNGVITSARINTKDKVEIKYGKIQARIKTPPGKGTWPAFWMLGSVFPEQPWPGAGEIDIMEMHQFYSDAKTTHFTVHWCDDSVSSDPCEYDPGWKFFSQFKTFDNLLTDDYHVFEAEWDENRLVGKIDGIPYFSKTINPDSSEEFLNSFFMILNVAVGGTLGGPPNTSTTWPQQMLVDWVRVYKIPKPDVLDLIREDSTGASTAYAEIINSVIFGGDSVVADLTSNAVTPLVGNKVLELDYRTANTYFSGGAFAFNQADLSDYSKLVFSIDISAFPNFDDIGIEMVDSRNSGNAIGKVTVPLSNYTPTISGNWRTYTIPLSDFNGVNLDNVTLFGFWNPVNAADQLIPGKLYIDNILFLTEPCTTNGSANFSADSYPDNTASAQITVSDSCLSNKTVVVLVNNGTDTIGIGITVDASGAGSATLNFGPTSDATSTIAINDGDVLALTYTDANGVNQNDTAGITSGARLGVYSETNISPQLTYTQIINVADFGGKNTVTDDMSMAIPPLEGSVELQADYSTAGPGGDYNGFVFNFVPLNLMSNGGFALPDATAGDVLGHTDWTQFNSSYTTAADGPNFAPVSHNPEDNQSVKQYGFDGGAFQDVAVVAGETYTGTVWAMNWTGNGTTDPFGEFGFMELSFRDGGGNVTGAFQAYVDPVDDGTNIYLPPQDGADISDWTQLTRSAVAPAGTASARILLIHQLVGGSGGTLRWDDASIYTGAPVPPADISTYATLNVAINTAATGLVDLEIKLEDTAAGAASVYLSAYTPISSTPDGWELYAIPLSAFTGVALNNIKYLGFWNASSTVSAPPGGTVTLLTGTLYFDDIYFSK